MTDITKNFSQSETSAAAGASISRDHKRSVKERIKVLAEQAGERGLTADEALSRLNLTHQSGSARFTELVTEGWLRPLTAWNHVGTERIEWPVREATRSGRMAQVYVFTDPPVPLKKASRRNAVISDDFVREVCAHIIHLRESMQPSRKPGSPLSWIHRDPLQADALKSLASECEEVLRGLDK